LPRIFASKRVLALLLPPCMLHVSLIAPVLI
jgi:hypothetical protein